MFHRSRAERIGDVLNYVVLAAIAAAMLFPFLYILIISFSSLEDVLRSPVVIWPDHWVTDAWRYILNSEAFLRSLRVSAFVTVVGTAVNLMLTAAMAYALSRPMLGRGIILRGVIFSMLFSAGLIPTYMVVRSLGLIDSLWALIIPSAISPFNLIVMRQFFLSIPEDVTEAALLDGANELRIFSQIILPLSKPALAAFGLFYAVGHWNSYFAAVIYLNDPQKWPVQVVLRQIVILNQTSSTLDTQAMLERQPPPITIQMAAVLIATIPILVVYPFLQKHFAKGVMIGAVK